MHPLSPLQRSLYVFEWALTLGIANFNWLSSRVLKIAPGSDGIGNGEEGLSLRFVAHLHCQRYLISLALCLWREMERVLDSNMGV